MSRMRSSKSSGGGVFVLRRAIALAAPSTAERDLTPTIVAPSADNCGTGRPAGAPAHPAAGPSAGRFAGPRDLRGTFAGPPRGPGTSPDVGSVAYSDRSAHHAARTHSITRSKGRT